MVPTVWTAIVWMEMAWTVSRVQILYYLSFQPIMRNLWQIWSKMRRSFASGNNHRWMISPTHSALEDSICHTALLQSRKSLRLSRSPRWRPRQQVQARSQCLYLLGKAHSGQGWERSWWQPTPPFFRISARWMPTWPHSSSLQGLVWKVSFA